MDRDELATKTLVEFWEHVKKRTTLLLEQREKQKRKEKVAQ